MKLTDEQTVCRHGMPIVHRRHCQDCEHEAEIAELERSNQALKEQLNEAVEVLKRIEGLQYDSYKDHTHMLYTAQMFARGFISSLGTEEANEKDGRVNNTD